MTHCVFVSNMIANLSNENADRRLMDRFCLTQRIWILPLTPEGYSEFQCPDLYLRRQNRDTSSMQNETTRICCLHWLTSLKRNLLCVIWGLTWEQSRLGMAEFELGVEKDLSHCGRLKDAANLTRSSWF